MNKKEMAEIRKQFTPERACIRRVAMMLISGEKEVLHMQSEPFAMLSEEDSLELMKMSRTALKGELGKQAFNISVSQESELDKNSCFHTLYELNKKGLDDDDLLQNIVDIIVENHENEAGPYFVTMVSFTYDIPSVTESEDDDLVYSGILTILSSAQQADIGLCFSKDSGIGRFSKQLLKSSKPMHTFLFPAFDDRTEDVHNALYCAGNAKDIEKKLTEALFGEQNILSAEEQKQFFDEAIKEASESSPIQFDTLADINRELYVMAEDEKAGGGEGATDPDDITEVIKNSGMDEEDAQRFEETYKELLAGSSSSLSAIVPSNMKIEVSDMVLSAKPEFMDLISVKIVDGKRSLVIEIRGDLTVNGLNVV